MIKSAGLELPADDPTANARALMEAQQLEMPSVCPPPPGNGENVVRVQQQITGMLLGKA